MIIIKIVKNKLFFSKIMFCSVKKMHSKNLKPFKIINLDT